MFPATGRAQSGVIRHMIHNGGTNIEQFNLFMEETSVEAGDNVQLTYWTMPVVTDKRQK